MAAPDAPLVWVFVPYAIVDGRLEGETYENDLTKQAFARAFASLGLPWIWQPVLVGQVDAVIAEVMRHRQQAPCLIFNLCDGFDRDGLPGLSVVRALERAGIPFTGADSTFYEISSSKLRMKARFVAESVTTPPYEILAPEGGTDGVCERLRAPVIVKPDLASASVGITLASRVSTDAAVAARRDALAAGGLPRHFADGEIFAERFIDGREFTVLLAGDWRTPSALRCFAPLERVFDPTLPEDERYLTCDRYWAYYREESLPPSGRFFFAFAGVEPALDSALRDLGRRGYVAVKGTGYGRVDIRMARDSGELFVLEVNANPEFAIEEQTTTGYVAKLEGLTFADLVRIVLTDRLETTAVHAPQAHRRS